MSTAVVTGPSERVADMALVLRLAGFEVHVPKADVRQIPIGVDEVDCYVQLPDDGPPVRALTARFDAAAQVAPKLASSATVVLVGDPPGVKPAPDMRLVRLLVEAVIADHGGGPVRMAIVDSAQPDDEVAAIAQMASRSVYRARRVPPRLRTFSDDGRRSRGRGTEATDSPGRLLGGLWGYLYVPPLVALLFAGVAFYRTVRTDRSVSLRPGGSGDR